MENSATMTTTGRTKYSLAGWLAIASTALIVPQIGLSVFLEFIGSQYKIILVPIRVANLAIGIYILYMFRSLLNERYDFHRTDTMITVLIWTNVVFFLLGVAELYFELVGTTLELGPAVLVLALLIPFGIVTIAFGVMLLKLQADLFGFLKPYAYSTIVSGVCGATIILMPIGLLAAIAALAIQGMIFLRAKDDVEYL